MRKACRNKSNSITTQHLEEKRVAYQNLVEEVKGYFKNIYIKSLKKRESNNKSAPIARRQT